MYGEGESESPLEDRRDNHPMEPLSWTFRIYRAVRSDDLQVLHKCTLDEFTGDQLAISMRKSDPKYRNRELLNRGEYRRLSSSQNA
jgi:hypothetical protein